MLRREINQGFQIRLAVSLPWKLTAASQISAYIYLQRWNRSNLTEVIQAGSGGVFLLLRC